VLTAYVSFSTSYSLHTLESANEQTIPIPLTSLSILQGGVPTCGYPGSPSSSDFPRLPECAPSAEREFVKAFRDDLLLWIRELCDGIMIMTTVAESNLIDPFD